MTEPTEDAAANPVVGTAAEQPEAGLGQAVEATMRGLDEAARLPVEERAPALEALHRQLAEALDASPEQAVWPPAVGG